MKEYVVRFLLGLMLLPSLLTAQQAVTLTDGRNTVQFTVGAPTFVVHPDTVVKTVHDTVRITDTLFLPPPADTVPTPPPPPTCGPNVSTSAQWKSAIAGGSGDVRVKAGTYPGESRIAASRSFVACGKVVLGNLYIAAANVSFDGFEVDGRQGASGTMGVNCRANNFRFINGVVHHAQMSGIGLWTECGGTVEIANDTIRNNGTHQVLKNGSVVSCFDHGLYAQGKTGSKLIHDNTIFGNLCYGVHLYAGAADQYLTGITLRDNHIWGHTLWADIVIGSTNNPASGIVLDGNCFDTGDLGWTGVKGKDLTLTNNSWQTPPIHLGNWTTVTQNGNVSGAHCP